MFYWLLSFFIGFLVIGDISSNLPAEFQRQESNLNQRAIQTVRYINEINDWRYKNPAQTEGTIPDSSLGWVSVPELHNVLQANRIFVYQENQPGLMSALQTQTNNSALVGKVINRRLIDSLGNDMQITVPAVITDGSLVYLN
ncbi:type IV pilus biogenesis protein PilM [Xenorhabdus sp. TS4]|uniref:type IV pilus biogenesis protein PilM n=1 Tax=Xenorhabdus sp. TS4 TaxID=1873483 RepID=UPI0016569C86|nr:type IV pilus biogenesis protein PilM [Xenorhabdus sp. TS4]MBC8950061.1 type IV pilus inner membrane platform protein PilM [Xenorhabdus sp. TS4]